MQRQITYPDIVVILDELRVSKQTPLQHGLQQSQVDHVEKQQSQNGQVHDDGYLNGQMQFISTDLKLHNFKC